MKAQEVRPLVRITWLTADSTLNAQVSWAPQDP